MAIVPHQLVIQRPIIPHITNHHLAIAHIIMTQQHVASEISAQFTSDEDVCIGDGLHLLDITEGKAGSYLRDEVQTEESLTWANLYIVDTFIHVYKYQYRFINKAGENSGRTILLFECAPGLQSDGETRIYAGVSGFGDQPDWETILRDGDEALDHKIAGRTIVRSGDGWAWVKTGPEL